MDNYEAFKTGEQKIAPGLIPSTIQDMVKGFVIDAGTNFSKMFDKPEYGTFGQIFDPATSNPEATIVPNLKRPVNFCFHQTALKVLGVNAGIVFRFINENNDYQELKNNTMVEVEYYDTKFENPKTEKLDTSEVVMLASRRSNIKCSYK